MNSLIGADHTLMIWTVILLIVALGFWSETKPIGQKLSGIVVVMGAAMLLSNIRILPTASGVYDIVWSMVVPVAIPILLLKANIRGIFKQTGTMMAAFLMATLSTVVGVFVAYFLVDIGDLSEKMSGVFTATYIGGSVNFAAMVEALEIEDTSLLSASVAADNLAGTLYLALISVLPMTVLIKKYFNAENTYSDAPEKTAKETTDAAAAAFNPVHMAIILAFGCLIAFAGKSIASLLSAKSYGLILTTVLAFAVANIFPKQLSKLKNEDTLGMFLMFIFFVAVGASADIVAIFNYGFSVFIFAFIIVIVHFSIVMGGAFLLRLNVYEVLIASNACIMGPATAAAQAASQHCKSLVTPAIICGSLAYAFANFLGLMVVKLLL